LRSIETLLLTAPYGVRQAVAVLAHVARPAASCFMRRSRALGVMPAGATDCSVHISYVHWHVDELRVEWNPAKARLNQRKHGVAFEEAQTVFADEDALLLADPAHSAVEDRFYLLGLNARLRVLVVIHCYRSEDGVVRLISARKATPSERAQYDARWTR
jgi:uncharacterized DUF497 family protein